MSFELVAYDKLKTSVRESVKTLVLHHNKDQKINPEKLEEAVKDLPIERKSQALLLLKTIELLDKTVDMTVKSRVLNALCYFIHQKIDDSYKNSYNPLVSSERSNFYTSLTTALELTKENQPGKNDLVDMYGELIHFFKQHVYIHADPRKGYMGDQPFALEGYDVLADIKTLIKKVRDVEVELVDAAEEKRQQQLKPKASTGILGGLFGGGATGTTSSKHKAKKEEAAVVTAGPQ
ncbi:hypothetical protein [Legionella shakespearei]|uniref:Dot/Icm T4SS effector n=1 Tax=Legionella shakespearei DSM 23087 TaxID=1122169 RepID=A0A0W0Z878_9GAMM|nr:hypothetical protein [Legionella shakespearei]KTD64998.1 Dot/Icm T4SS effector [Legionella shakespearei DSM 23087]